MNKKLSLVPLAGIVLASAMSMPASVSAQQTESYTVQPGDTLYSIGVRKGVNVFQLEEANNDISNPDVIYAGQTIVLPFQERGEPSPTSDQYIVRPADTLSGIARRQGTTADAIASANNLPDPDFIVVNQELVIPGTESEEPSEPLPPTPTDYTVQPGDTLSDIAEAYGMTAEHLADNNPLAISDPDQIYPGMVLVIP